MYVGNGFGLHLYRCECSDGFPSFFWKTYFEVYRLASHTGTNKCWSFFGIVLVCNVNPTLHKPGDSSAVVDGPLPKQRPEETLGSWKFDFDFPTG